MSKNHRDILQLAKQLQPQGKATVCTVAVPTVIRHLVGEAQWGQGEEQVTTFAQPKRDEDVDWNGHTDMLFEDGQLSP